MLIILGYIVNIIFLWFFSEIYKDEVPWMGGFEKFLKISFIILLLLVPYALGIFALIIFLWKLISDAFRNIFKLNDTRSSYDCNVGREKSVVLINYYDSRNF